MSKALCRDLDKLVLTYVDKGGAIDDTIHKMVVRYNNVSHKRNGQYTLNPEYLRNAPTGVLKNTTLWNAMARCYETALSVGAAPMAFLEAQFDQLKGTIVCWQMFGISAVRRYTLWNDRQSRLYLTKNTAPQQEKAAANNDVLLSAVATLDAGLSLWKNMHRPSIMAIATNAPNLLPALFFISFLEIEGALRRGLLLNDLLRSTLALVDANPDLAQVVRGWRERHM